jgi:hypothetical protein
MEGLGQLKNPVISLGIEPVTFQLIGRCLNQLRYHVPPEPKGATQLISKPATGYDPGSIPSVSHPHSLLRKIYLNLPSHLAHCLQFPRDSLPKFCMQFSFLNLAA